MGFNKKSYVGPQQGTQGRDDDSSIMLYQEAPFLIDILSFDSFGHNANHIKPHFRIHEAYGVNVNNQKGIVKIANEFYYDEDELDTSNVDVTSDLGSMTPGKYRNVTYTLYDTRTNPNKNFFVDRFEPADSTKVFDSNTTLYPCVPSLYPWKFLLDISGADYQTFAGHQIQCPVILADDYTPITNSVSGIDVSIDNGGTSRINNDTTANILVGLNSSYSLGDDFGAGTLPSKGYWSAENNSDTAHLRSMRITDASTDANGVTLILLGSAYASLGVSIVTIPANGLGISTDIYSDADALTGVDNQWHAIGMCYIADKTQALTDLAAEVNKTGNVNTKSLWGYATLHWILTEMNAATVTTFGDLYLHCGIAKTDYATHFTAQGWSSSAVLEMYYAKDAFGTKSHYSTLTSALFRAINHPKIDDKHQFRFTTEVEMEVSSYDTQEQGEDTDYGYVRAYDSGMNAAFMAGRCGCRKMTMIYEPSTDTNFEMTIGFYSTNFIMDGGPTSAGWHDITIGGAAVSAEANTMTEYDCYSIEFDNIYNSAEIFDPQLQGSRFMTAIKCKCHTSQPEYDINTVATGVSDDFTDTPSYSSTTGLSVVHPKKDSSLITYLILVDNIAQKQTAGLATPTISSPKVKMVISISETWALTWVKMNITENYGYFGILNKNDYKHYTAHTIYNHDSDTHSLIFDELPEINSVKVLNSSDVEVNLVIGITVSGKKKFIYSTLKQVKSIPGSIFLKDDDMRDDYYSEQYLIDGESNTVSFDNINPKIGSNLGTCRYQSAGTYKTFYPIEYDDNIALINEDRSATRLNISSLIGYPSLSMLSKSIVNIQDVSDFATNAIKIPFMHPTEGLLMTVDDVGSEAYPDIDSGAETAADFILKNLYYATRMMNYNPNINTTLGGKNREQKTGSISVITMPAIDKTIKSYANLPEKTTTVLGTTDVNNLLTIGTEIAPANNIAYTIMGKNAYRSSNIRFCPADKFGIFDLEGDIYYSGNIFCVTSEDKTFIYSINDNSNPSFVKSIDDEILANPVMIAGDVVFVCEKRIYTMKLGPIYDFEYDVEEVDIKPASGNGYLLFVKSNSRYGDVALVANDDDPLLANDSDPLEVNTLTDNYLMFNIGSNLEVVKMNIEIAGTSPSEMDLIKNNCRGSDIALFWDITSSSYGFISNAYTIVEYTTYHTDAYIESEPFYLRDQNARRSFCQQIYYYTKGYGTIRMVLTDGITDYSDITTTINSDDTAAYTETHYVTGMIAVDNLYYKMYITPETENSLEIQMAKMKIVQIEEK